MVHKLVTKLFRPVTLIPLLLLVIGFYALADIDRGQSEPVPYEVLDDQQTRIRIAVAPEVDEKQLRATLRKAADDHQNDPERDLLLSTYMWVEVYLLDGQRQSAAPAGKLRRYVPPKQPREHKDWLDWLPDLVGKKDKFYLTLEKARKSLQ